MDVNVFFVSEHILLGDVNSYFSMFDLMLCVFERVLALWVYGGWRGDGRSEAAASARRGGGAEGGWNT